MRNLFALAFHLITLNYASFKLQLTGLFGPHIQDKISGYNETRVIELMTDIYGVLTRFGYFDEVIPTPSAFGITPNELTHAFTQDEIRYPPPEGHHLNFSQVPSNVTFDPRVVSLMRKLPAPPTPDDRAIFPMMRPGDYLNAESLAESRDIDDCSGSYQDWSNHPERPYNFFNAGPTELRLLQGAPDATDEPDLVLNVANSMSFASCPLLLVSINILQIR